MKWQNDVEKVTNEALAPDWDNDLQGDRLDFDRLYALPLGEGRTTVLAWNSFDSGHATYLVASR